MKYKSISILLVVFLLTANVVIATDDVLKVDFPTREIWKRVGNTIRNGISGNNLAIDGQITSNNKLVCLEDGTNCQATNQSSSTNVTTSLYLNYAKNCQVVNTTKNGKLQCSTIPTGGQGNISSYLVKTSFSTFGQNRLTLTGWNITIGWSFGNYKVLSKIQNVSGLTQMNNTLNALKNNNATALSGINALNETLSPIPTMVMKTGSKGGTPYTRSASAWGDIDRTNLSYTVTVPVGYKIMITAHFSGYSSGASHKEAIGLFNGTTLLVMNNDTWGIIAGGALPMSLGYIHNGTGTPHTYKLRFANNGLGTTGIENSAKGFPVMNFLVVRSN